MSSPRGARGTSGQVQRLSRDAVAWIAEYLQDPDRRDRAVANGRTLVEMAQQWREDRLPSRDGPGLKERISERASERYGVGRLRSRVDRLGIALDELSGHSPELAEALREMRSKVREVEQRIPAAEALRGRPRRKMLRAFDRRLDAIEGALADAMLASPGDSD